MKTQGFTILVVVPFNNFPSYLNSEIWAFCGQREMKLFLFPEISLVVFRETDHTGKRVKNKDIFMLVKSLCSNVVAF